MKIVQLTAENFKRLKAIDITPDGALVEITGRNGQGKTSVLDAIWAALGGRDAAPPMPIRKGEEEAKISLDLGTLKVIRKFRAQEDGSFTTSLIVESDEGARFPSPQGVLDALVGALTFDPLAFKNMPAKDQFATCRAFVPDVDFAKIEQLNRGDFERRRDINRDHERATAEAAAIRVALPEGVELPSALIDEEPLVAKLHGASEVETKRRRRAADRERIARLEAQAREIADEIERTKKLLEEEGEPEDVDAAALNQELAKVRLQNEALRTAVRKKEAEERAAKLKAQADELTEAMKKRQADAAAAVAKAKMPVPGMGFGDGVVLLDGVPFEQASDAEQLRASIAIAGAMNPRLRIVRVRDGSLLDAEAFKILEAYAAANDLQVWIETVQSGRGHAVLIENGEVASAPTPSVKVEPEGEIL